MMFPSLRGGNENPGEVESFFGEVDDVIAAAEFLAEQPYVDPERIYLGGHSTGGTLALLVAESTDRFRAVFAFGPVEDVNYYGDDYLAFDTSIRREGELRAPIRWLHCITTPVFLLEGEDDANGDSVLAMLRTSKNPLVNGFVIPKADHFSVLAPVNQLIAGKLLQDTGETVNIAFTAEELAALFDQ